MLVGAGCANAAVEITAPTSANKAASVELEVADFLVDQIDVHRLLTGWLAQFVQLEVSPSMATWAIGSLLTSVKPDCIDVQPL